MAQQHLVDRVLAFAGDRCLDAVLVETVTVDAQQGGTADNVQGVVGNAQLVGAQQNIAAALGAEVAAGGREADLAVGAEGGGFTDVQYRGIRPGSAAQGQTE
ncbi:hypothetical protein D3C76_958190 [compost metagenome]